MASAKKEKYAFTPEFERAVVRAACTRPSFFGLFCAALDPESFTLAGAKLALLAARAIERDSGRGPESTVLVLQRVRSWMAEGKHTQEDLETVAQLFDDADADPALPEDQISATLVPLLRRRIERDALSVGYDSFQKKGDLQPVVDMIVKAKFLGQQNVSRGQRVRAAGLSNIIKLSNVSKLPTGIIELDEALKGGAPIGTLSMFIAMTGGGKSMGLVHMAAIASLSGLNVVYATLELPEREVYARLVAATTGVTIDEIKDPDSDGHKEALDHLEALEEIGAGNITVKEFTPKATTIADVRAWVKDVEQEQGERVHVVVVDYADKLGDGKKTKDDQNSYASALHVYEDFRIWMDGEKRWGWTASQSKRGPQQKRGKAKLDVDDVADSLHKVRVADIVVTLNVDDDMVTFFIAKNRTQEARKTVGPLPTEFAIARLAAMTPKWDPSIWSAMGGAA